VHGQESYPLKVTTPQSDIYKDKSTTKSFIITNVRNLSTARLQTTQLNDSIKQTGYINSTITKEAYLANDTIRSTITLGKYYKYIRLSNDSISSFPKPNTDVLYIKDRFICFETAFAKAYLEKLATAQSSPFTTVQVERLKILNDSTLEGNLIINKQKNRTIDQITVKGYAKMPTSFIKHYAKLKTQTPFELTEAQKKLDRLNDLDFITITSPAEAYFTKDSTTVYVYAKKKSANSFDGILGFQSNPESNKLETTGYLELDLVNNLNYGERLAVDYRNDGNNQSQFSLELTTPYIFKSPLQLNYQLELFKKDSLFASTSNQIEALYTPRSRINTGIYFKNTTSTSLSGTDTSPTIPTTEDFSKNEVGLIFTYFKTQDNNLAPTKTNARITTAVGNRKNQDQTSNQTLFHADVSHIFNLNIENSFYTRIHFNGIFASNYLNNELIRLGGIQSIRGFNENILLANIALTLQTEYRYTLSPTLYINTIIDVGRIENELINQKSNLYAFGLGAGLISNSTLFKLGYANGNIEGQAFKTANSKLHISIITRF